MVECRYVLRLSGRLRTQYPDSVLKFTGHVIEDGSEEHEMNLRMKYCEGEIDPFSGVPVRSFWSFLGRMVAGGVIDLVGHELQMGYFSVGLACLYECFLGGRP